MYVFLQLVQFLWRTLTNTHGFPQRGRALQPLESPSVHREEWRAQRWCWTDTRMPVESQHCHCSGVPCGGDPSICPAAQSHLPEATPFRGSLQTVTT